MGRKRLLDQLMDERIAYGGFAVRRADVYRDAVAHRHTHKAADYIAFHPPALADGHDLPSATAEDLASLDAGAHHNPPPAVSAAVELGYNSPFAVVVSHVERYYKSDGPPCPVCARRFNSGFYVRAPHQCAVCSPACVARLIGCDIYAIGEQISGFPPRPLCQAPFPGARTDAPDLAGELDRLEAAGNPRA